MKKKECMLIGKDSSGNNAYVRVFVENEKVGIGVDYSIAVLDNEVVEELIKALKYAKTHKPKLRFE